MKRQITVVGAVLGLVLDMLETVQSAERKWPWNGSAINVSPHQVTVWSDIIGLHTIKAHSMSNLVREDIDHIQDRQGQWYKIGARSLSCLADAS